MLRFAAKTLVAALAAGSAFVGVVYADSLIGTGRWSTSTGDMLNSLGVKTAARAANNAEMTAYRWGGRITRDGFATGGDGGRADYTHSVTDCTISGGDGGAQIPSGSGGCFILDPASRFTPRIWGATGGDDTTAWTKALSYLGGLGGSRVLFNELASSTISSTTQTIIPSNVAIECGGRFEGGDGSTSTSLPTIAFTQKGGGFYMADQSAVSGCHIYSSAAANDHVIEYAGKIGLDRVRVTAPNNGILVTDKLSVGSTLDSVGSTLYSTPGTGLTNGTYSNVAFTETKGSGAKLTVVVSGGSITSATVSTAGSGYIPYACASLASGALYSGSPALSCIGYTVTANTGRSRFNSVYIVNCTKVCLEVDGAYDFPTADDVECWHPNGRVTAGNKCIRVGKADGLVISRLKAWAVDWAVYADGPLTMPPQYTTVTAGVFDNVNNGIFVGSAQDNFVISGNVCRATGGSCESLNSLTANVTISGNDEFCIGQPCTYVQLAKNYAVTGNNYHGMITANKSYVTISPNVTLSSPNVTNGIVSGNGFDGLADGIYLNPNAGRVTIGPNSWPKNSAYKYVSNNTEGGANDGSIVSWLPSTGGKVGVTLDANGRATIPHKLGAAPQQPSASLFNAPTGYGAQIVAVDATNITIQVTKPDNTAASGNFNVFWRG